MALTQVLGVLLSLLPAQAPLALLQEPDYFTEKNGDKWTLRKPALQIFEPAEGAPPRAWTIFEDEHRITVEQRKNALPRLRLNRALVQFHPLTRRRQPIADWTGQSDAREIESDIHTLLNRFAPASSAALLSSTPIYMARLNGATGHTAEELGDHRRFVIYMDPFRATGRLHAASTLIHELSHIERYRSRGFHANRAVAVLSKPDFILLGVVDELAAYQAEATLIASFLNSISSSSVLRAVRNLMPSAELRWPAALMVLLGFEGSSDPPTRMKEAREQIVLDIHRQASAYWEIHHDDSLDPLLEATVRKWYSGSREWAEIAGQRRNWLDAGAEVTQ